MQKFISTSTKLTVLPKEIFYAFAIDDKTNIHVKEYDDILKENNICIYQTPYLRILDYAYIGNYYNVYRAAMANMQILSYINLEQVFCYDTSIARALPMTYRHIQDEDIIYNTIYDGAMEIAKDCYLYNFDLAISLAKLQIQSYIDFYTIRKFHALIDKMIAEHYSCRNIDFIFLIDIAMRFDNQYLPKIMNLVLNSNNLYIYQYVKHHLQFFREPEAFLQRYNELAN